MEFAPAAESRRGLHKTGHVMDGTHLTKLGMELDAPIARRSERLQVVDIKGFCGSPIYRAIGQAEPM